MPKREKLFTDLTNDKNYVVPLVLQAGGMPGELQLIIETAQLDEEQEALRPINNYIIRVLGVMEYRMNNIGTTAENVDILENHPLLYQYRSIPVAVFFRGVPEDVNEFLIDLSQAHASTFMPWRYFPTYLNIQQPLVDLLEAGGGLLGQMPHEMAERVGKVLEKHGLESKMMEGNPPEPQAKIMVIGSSYFVAPAFSIEELGRV